MPLPTPMSVLFTLGRLAGMALLAAPLLAGADDNYLSEIEDEAKRQATTLTTSQPPAPILALPAPGVAAERLAPDLDRTAFEHALREGLPKETYASFQRLNPASQQRIYESYRSDSRLANISEQIARLLGGKP